MLKTRPSRQHTQGGCTPGHPEMASSHAHPRPSHRRTPAGALVLRGRGAWHIDLHTGWAHDIVFRQVRPHPPLFEAVAVERMAHAVAQLNRSAAP
eukprot:scaffold24_cov245-Pinguiococcus_pyrenoidosus.AAC.28